MPVLLKITPALAADFKTVRLNALQDAPLAFGSTFAQESQLSDADWIARVEAFEGQGRVAFLARDKDKLCGLLGAQLEPDTQCARLVSMWVAPAYRKTGLGTRLIAVIEEWALLRDVRNLILTVVDTNVGAIQFYERNGFAKTGRTEPYPNDARRIEYEMVKPLSQCARLPS